MPAAIIALWIRAFSIASSSSTPLATAVAVRSEAFPILRLSTIMILESARAVHHDDILETPVTPVLTNMICDLSG